LLNATLLIDVVNESFTGFGFGAPGSNESRENGEYWRLTGKNKTPSGPHVGEMAVSAGSVSGVRA
jgi:hypothetical protein